MRTFDKLVKNLEKSGFSVSVFQKKEDAASYLTEKIKGKTVGFGGSKTAEELGLFEKLSASNTCLFHWKKPGSDTLFTAQNSDVYISSVNAVSENGELVNIDGTCNRIASTLYGHGELYFIIGKNKLCPDLESAIYRARNIAAPLNARRLGRKTPCAAAGKCCDCQSPERICSAMTVHWRRPGGIPYAEIVLIEESLGL